MSQSVGRRLKLLFASPTYGPVDPQALASQRVAIMHAARHGYVDWCGDASPDRMKFDVARDAVAGATCEHSEAEAVFWCDSDVILPSAAISTLAGRMLDLHLDFLTGIYFQRESPHYPLIATFNEAVQSFQWLVEWPPNVVVAVDGCGFGCVVTSKRLLQAVGRAHGRWFAYERYSEDFDFCRKASALRMPPHVDTSVVCGHLRDAVAATHNDFRREFKAASRVRVNPESAA